MIHRSTAGRLREFGPANEGATLKTIAILALAAVLLAGCDPASSPSEERGGKAASGASAIGGAFSHTQTQDLSGYYVPNGQVGPGDFQLTSLFIGQAQEFQDWEGGKRPTTFAPVMLEFSGERVLPDSYSISDGRLRITGTSSSHGRITFDGRLDVGALANARRNLGNNEAPALTGALTIDGRTYSGLKLGYSVGD